jgi:hypothetical protein
MPVRNNHAELAILLDFYGDMLTEKQREYLDQYTQNDLSLSEIAANEGITRQGVRDIVTRAEGVLREYESKLGIIARFGGARDHAVRIRALTEEILTVNQRRYGNLEIEQAAHKIRQIAQDMAGTAEG